MDCGRVQQARANPDLARHHRGAACAWGGVSLLPSKCLCWAGAAFSRFFSAVLDHNGIKDLHLQPNSILLLSFLAFYYEAFIGVQRSVAVLRHCFSLLLQDGAHLSARVSFLAAEKRPLCEYRAGDDELRLRSQDLPAEDSRRFLAILLGGDPGDLPEAVGPLYRHDNTADLVAAMPIFNEQGLLPAEGSGPMEVSSGDTSGEGGSDKTVDDRAVSVLLPSQFVLLREIEDDAPLMIPLP
ncbi:hypothetical protein D1007_00406 [Hordeum vulgare]|nr:hypothetical protein D1007_00406 [Hordeum vulgare]